MRLAVPKDSRLRHAASHGLFTRRYPFIASLVLCYQKQEATIGQLKEDFRVAAARLIARLDEQDSKIQKVSGPA